MDRALGRAGPFQTARTMGRKNLSDSGEVGTIEEIRQGGDSPFRVN